MGDNMMKSDDFTFPKSKEKSKKAGNSKIKTASIHLGAYLFVISIVLWIAYGIMQFALQQNVKNRTFAELNEKVKMQVTMLEEMMNQEYSQLRMLNSILTFHRDEIEDEPFDYIWESLREEENITMLGISDCSGNIINWNGEMPENVSQVKCSENVLFAGGGTFVWKMCTA